MLLKALKVTNSQGDLLELPLEDISSGFVVRKIEGLDPVKATLVSSSFANMDGAQYHSSRREARNIKFDLGLSPDYGSSSVKDLRDQLYSFFMPKTRVKLEFVMFDHHAETILSHDLEIDARIETFESELFTKDPSVDISMLCFNPDFVDPEEVIFQGNTVDNQDEEIIDYEGTVETGVVFTLFPNRSLSQFSIYHHASDQTLNAVEFAYPLISGDQVEISSIRGDKHVLLRRGGEEFSILYAITPQSSWIEFEKGDNNFRVYAEGAPVPYEVRYFTRYGGL